MSPEVTRQQGSSPADTGTHEPSLKIVRTKSRTRLMRRLATSDVLPRSAVPFLLVAAFVIFSFLSPHLFFTWTNIRVMIAAQSSILLLAVAATIPLRAGEFDLSIASVMVLCACVVGILYGHGVPPLLCCLVSLACGLAVGLVNSLFVVGLKLGGFIVTLGMLTVLTGLTLFINQSNLVSSIPAPIVSFANVELLTLPVAVWVGWGIALLVWFVFELTPLGRYLLFLGGSPAAAALAGLRVSRLRCGSYVASSLIAAIAGILLAGTLGAVDPSSASAYLLPPFTAAFLGTTTIYMGRFNIAGTLVGLYLIAVGITGLQLLGVQAWVSEVFNGGALIVAIAFARLFEVQRGRSLLRAATAKQSATAEQGEVAGP
jgi:ribose transport system permease protein